MNTAGTKMYGQLSRRQLSHRLVWTAVVVLLLGTPVPAQTGPSTQPADAFAGLWAVSVTPDTAAAQQGVQAFDDKLLFEDGKLTAEACAKYGLAPSGYSLNVSGTTGRTYFTSEMQSDTQGTLTWTGAVSTTGLRGRLTWAKADGSTSTYRLRGNRTQAVDEVIQSDVEATE